MSMMEVKNMYVNLMVIIEKMGSVINIEFFHVKWARI